MNKQELVKLFKKLFVKESRTISNWRDLVQSMNDSGDIKNWQCHRWTYFQLVQCVDSVEYNNK